MFKPGKLREESPNKEGLYIARYLWQVSQDLKSVHEFSCVGHWNDGGRGHRVNGDFFFAYSFVSGMREMEACLNVDKNEPIERDRERT